MPYQDGKKAQQSQSLAEDKMNEIPIQPIALTTPFIPPQFQSYMSNFMKNLIDIYIAFY